MSESNPKPQILFASHGGGPLPLLGDPGHGEMVTCLQSIAGKLRRPSAILVVSAHWEERVPTITSGVNPALIYDYYGFPQESYSIQYPCPGEPELAQEVHKALEHAGITSVLDSDRGFDHGLFVPLKLLFPQADIPCIQLSLNSNLDAAQHLAMGAALQGLAGGNLLVIGSGFSFHNMRAFFSAETAETLQLNESFEQWLHETCTSADMSEPERTQRFIHWDKAPGARFCHPREEHLLPLHVCYGLANRHCSEAFELKILNKRASMYLWQ
ncbi:class III extradiol ring-cleavage dioxygenase [Microbulbifer bruguierae]|uniref:Class III extradiol ring-cleavage dioxygenase n=1 Tax=Microbulbifer bruguierae TaxID=3029061 RepID=A0ABY8N9Y9_9GAMM|nr:class III extradiol ring-cleavage dioxygenase [Microbulbifer bruguierae]WGL15720.1 class III extradiol ring-cleavage dioxygenase [Microbulbifer bruguierae]